MPSLTNEQALESVIEKSLTGNCLEEIKNIGIADNKKELYRAGNGYYLGEPKDFNAKYAIDEKRL